MINRIVILWICLLVVPQDAAGQVREQQNTTQHTFYAAFGSPSLYTSLNYEISVFEKSNFTLLPRVGFGANIFQPSAGKEWNFITGLTGLYGKKKSKFEAILGWVHQLYPSYSYEQEKDIIKYKGIIYTGMGYRYQPCANGLMFKLLITPTLTINPNKWEFFPYAEIAVGYALRTK